MTAEASIASIIQVELERMYDAGQQEERDRITKFLMPYLEKAVTLGLTVSDYEAVKKGLKNEA